MMPLYPVNANIGGTQVVPRSHTREGCDALKERHPQYKNAGDWCVLGKRDPMQAEARLLLADPGDFILWDSRTVHGGLVGPAVPPEHEELPEVIRMSVPVCMTPRAWASEEVLETRREGFAHGVCFNHWPHYTHAGKGAINAKAMQGNDFTPIELTPEQQALL